MRTTPSTTAMVAGTAPCRRTASSMRRAVAAAVSVGRPWLMIVDSRATTPAPDAIASVTSSDSWRGNWFTRAFCRVTQEEGTTVLVACLGDVMLDVLVDAPGGLVPDDDTPAHIRFESGGQAANVAAWVCALGGRARVYGPRSGCAQGRVVEEALAARGVQMAGRHDGRLGVVLSLTSGATRTMASDAGDPAWLAGLEPGAWLADADWLFVSGYALVRAPDPERIVRTAAAARAAGTRVALDLASAAMAGAYGAEDFAALCTRTQPAVVFANDAEWAAFRGGFHPGGRTVLALKHGARGATFVIDGVPDDRSAEPGPVLDVTGAGDALAAGYLVGGIDLAMRAAARCVAQRGAQPAEPAR